jgi:hypothetical protein
MTIATTPAPDRGQAAVSDAAKRLYDAEAALHIARQTGVGSWISAAYDRLHEAIAGHTAAVDALKGCNRAVPPAPPCPPPACGRVSQGRGRGEAPQPRTTSGPCGGPSGTKAFPATVERLDQFAGIPATITSVVIAERRPR